MIKNFSDLSTNASGVSSNDIGEKSLGSGAAGTRRYMAPELKNITNNDQKLSPKIDIYALGIIFCDLICGVKTAMEQQRIEDKIKASKPQLPPGYKLENLVEGELLLKLVDPDPSLRPSIEQIRSDWLPQWEKQL